MTIIRNTVIASLALAGLASPAFAAERASGAASSTRNTSAAVTRTNEDGSRYNPRICVRDTPTGSRIARMVCHSRDEWQNRYFEVPGEGR